MTWWTPDKLVCGLQTPLCSGTSGSIGAKQGRNRVTDGLDWHLEGKATVLRFGKHCKAFRRDMGLIRWHTECGRAHGRCAVSLMPECGLVICVGLFPFS
jgi:hypothetical protein